MTKYVTVYDKFSKIPPSTSIHFATRVRISRVIRQSFLHISLCGQQHPKCEPANRFLYLPLFYQFRFSSNSTKKKSNKNWAPDSNTSNSVSEKYHEILQSGQSLAAIFSKWIRRDFTFGALALVQLSCSMTVQPAGSYELVDLCQQTKQVPEVSLFVIINITTIE